jgi:membrane protease YdiL (CAAX protease family)
VLGLIAIVGLAFRAGGPIPALAATIAPLASLAIGLATGLGSSLVLWLIRKVPPLRELQWFQQRLVQGWTVSDALAVAVLSGVAEEALLRALLQPIVGLLAAAALFAVLHLVPDRRLWLWPVIAFALGVVLGLLYETAGYPAAAAAHVAINACALLRLRHLSGEDSP